MSFFLNLMSLSLSRFGFGGQKTTARKYHKFREGSWLSLSLSHSYYSISLSLSVVSVSLSVSQSHSQNQLKVKCSSMDKGFVITVT